MPPPSPPTVPLDDDSLTRRFREQLRARLAQREWQPGTLDRLAMLAPGSTRLWIDGRRAPTLETIERVSIALECSALDLLQEPATP